MVINAPMKHEVKEPGDYFVVKTKSHLYWLQQYAFPEALVVYRMYRTNLGKCQRSDSVKV
jgi:hypothetical protein